MALIASWRDRIVLIVCGANEFNRIKIENCLSRMGVRYAWLNPQFRECNFTASFGWAASSREFELALCDGRRLDWRRVIGVWNRGASSKGPGQVQPGTDDNLYLAELSHSHAYIWSQLQHCNWVNPLGAARSNNRLMQMSCAMASGLPVPETIVSSRGDDLNSFVAKHRDCIVKRISQGSPAEAGPGMILTTRLPSDVTFADDVGAPVLLQKLVKKRTEIRVAVVGQRVLAGEINLLGMDEDMVDSRLWVNTKRSYQRVQLDDDTSHRLVRLNKDLGFRYSSMDLIRGIDGQLTFLEANPGGQWSFLEAHTGLPITESICSELIAER